MAHLIMEHRHVRFPNEYFVRGLHLSRRDLTVQACLFNRTGENQTKNYIFNDVPSYPQPEFHVSHLKHDTHLTAFMKIQEDGGFRNPNITEDRPPLVWWSLNLRPEDITSAEARFLQNKYPDLITPQAQAEARFLEHFATSPAFLKTSRLGSYRFTVSVEDVLNAYSQQFCSGAAPVLRAFETILYKKEVMYVVLVHSPDHQQYEDYPLLGDDPGTVCYYRDGQFIWTAQAMCSTHRYELVKIPEENQFRADKLNRGIYYIWDNVAIALHMEKDQVLKFDPDKLSVTPCEQDEIVYRDNFDSLKEAEGHIKRSPWRLLK